MELKLLHFVKNSLTIWKKCHVLVHGNVLIVGDFNIDFMDSSAYEYNKFINILDTFDFIQHINMPTHSSGHLLDYIITSVAATYSVCNYCYSILQ